MLRESRSPGATTPGANAYDGTLPSTTRVTRDYPERTPGQASYGGAIFPQHARLLADSAISRVGMSVGPHRNSAIDQMRALIADLDHWHREIGSAFREGYSTGYQAGYEVGYGRAHEEIAEAWREVAEHVRAYGRPGLDPYHELRRRRYQPGGEAYLAALARRGGREYTGGPVEWDPQHEPADQPHQRLVRGTA